MTENRLRTTAVFLHRWLGLLVGIVFSVVGLSGTIITFAPELTRMTYPVLDGPLPSGHEQARAAVLAAITREYPRGTVGLVRFPDETLPAYELWLADESRDYRHAVSGELLLHRELDDDLLTFARELHVSLLAGHNGERVLGWLGLGMLVLLITGLWLWWPRNGAWRTIFRIPPVFGWRPQLYYWHKTIGTVSLLLLLFVTLTGTAIVFYTPVQIALTTVFGGSPEAPPRFELSAAATTDWNVVFGTLDATLPEGRAVFLYPPAGPDAPLVFRKKMPAELHPNGRSFIYMRANGALLQASDATRAAAGLRATQAMYPLHAGKTGSETWRWLVAISGLLPAFFFVTGLAYWLLKRRD